jgi:hypothetical protein
MVKEIGIRAKSVFLCYNLHELQAFFSQREEKEYFMTVSLRKTFLLVVLALILLVGLLGWTLRVMASSAIYHSTSIHSSHAIAYTCPPPPRYC